MRVLSQELKILEGKEINERAENTRNYWTTFARTVACWCSLKFERKQRNALGPQRLVRCRNLYDEFKEDKPSEWAFQAVDLYKGAVLVLFSHIFVYTLRWSFRKISIESNLKDSFDFCIYYVLWILQMLTCQSSFCRKASLVFFCFIGHLLFSLKAEKLKRGLKVYDTIFRFLFGTAILFKSFFSILGHYTNTVAWKEEINSSDFK